MSTPSAPPVTLEDVILLLGQKEVELQYEKARVVKAQRMIADLQAQLKLALQTEGH